MPSLKEIKSRIHSVKSTQKITNAMKLVSAAKFAKAGHAIQNARPYGQAFDSMLHLLLAKAGEKAKSPLTEARAEKRVLMVIMATDRGLCGGLNTNLFKAVNRKLAEFSAAGTTVEFVAWGRKAISYTKRLEKIKLVSGREKVLEKPNYDFANNATKDFVSQFLTGDYDAVYLAYPRFASAISQVPTVEKLLPVTVPAVDQKEQQAAIKDVIVEPNLEGMLQSLLQRKIVGTLYRASLDVAASEHGARMSAMDSATRNAKEVIRQLTLKFNRARQAAITTELTEIISGAQALN